MYKNAEELLAICSEQNKRIWSKCKSWKWMA